MGLLGRHVVDKTGLTGMFDFTLEWSPDPPAGSEPNPDEIAPGPAFSKALFDQSGLRLISGSGPVEILVVDRIEHPSEN
jgi:uncharacterized protein (TIGR03435 family)